MQTVRPGDAGLLAEAAGAFSAARRPCALTGAGVSVESGIPDFRSPGGLWTDYPPEEYATLSAFRRDPARAWRLFRALDALLRGRRPNPAHAALAALEAAGRLELLVTQNIDGLHQAAGSQRVAEIHGDGRRLHCIACGRLEEAAAGRVAGGGFPRCPGCGAPLKPNVVLFEEPVRGLGEIAVAIGRCDLLLVAGTSALVHPAASLPGIVRRSGGLVLEFNLEATALTREGGTDYFFPGPAGETLPRFAAAALGAAPGP